MKNILILSSSPRKNGNSQKLCEAFQRGAEENGNAVKLIRLADKNIGYCKACDYCMRNNGVCIQKDDMQEILEQYQKADVLVLATPVYFYGVCAQMKTFIDRTYPIWQHLGQKEVYYIVSAGLDEEIVKRSIGDLDGFVEHLEHFEIKGRIYATHIMEAGKVSQTPVLDIAYQMGCQV
ncbi:MAG: flavodoxin family protein [Butyricicoccus sp.]|nr:flavodoxin family protein [Butyricicoccus sp.]